MEQVSDEEVEVRGEEEEEEEDSDKEDQDLDKMFGAWLGELDKLTQVLCLVKCNRLHQNVIAVRWKNTLMNELLPRCTKMETC